MYKYSFTHFQNKQKYCIVDSVWRYIVYKLYVGVMYFLGIVYIVISSRSLHIYRSGTETTPYPVRISTTLKYMSCINGWICQTQKRRTRTLNTYRECWFFSTVCCWLFANLWYHIVFIIIQLCEFEVFVRYIDSNNYDWSWCFVVASTAFVFCICLANIEYCEGLFQYAIMLVIGVSAVILVIIMFMLYRLPQAIENLSFKVILHTQYTYTVIFYRSNLTLKIT